MQAIGFKNFSRWETGRIVSHCIISKGETLVVAYARNPYGTHNLMLLIADDPQSTHVAIAHGNGATIGRLQSIAAYYPGIERLYRSALKFLATREVAK
jgi:hypothetical protein